MKNFIAIAVFCFTGALAGALLASNIETADHGWQLVYAHDENGAPTEGSKDALIAAVKAGNPVRVYWAGRRVQHVTDGGFLTILQGEVFAQMAPITGQKPSIDPASIELQDNQWQTVFATNGDRALRWFVQR